MKFLILILAFFLPISIFGQKKGKSSKSSHKYIVVVIDAGHGGKDPGKLASSKKYKNEKHLTLAMAKKLGSYLKKMKRVKVIYTRTTDKTLTLDQRVDIANNSKADIFVSIHCNSARRKDAKGASFHIHTKYCPTDYKLAKAIENDFIKRVKRPVMGIKDYYDRRSNLQVLQYVNMPAVIIETGFLTNQSEEKYLNTEKGQTYIASGIYRGIKKYLSLNLANTKVCREYVYKVQVIASRTRLPTNHKVFRRLSMRVEQSINQKSPFKYRYVVGHEYERSKIEKVKRRVIRKGFKDAFIIISQNSM